MHCVLVSARVGDRRLACRWRRAALECEAGQCWRGPRDFRNSIIANYVVEKRESVGLIKKRTTKKHEFEGQHLQGVFFRSYSDDIRAEFMNDEYAEEFAAVFETVRQLFNFELSLRSVIIQCEEIRTPISKIKSTDFDYPAHLHQIFRKKMSNLLIHDDSLPFFSVFLLVPVILMF